jgi:hypothetical protein
MRHMKSDRATAASKCRSLSGLGQMPHNAGSTPLYRFEVDEPQQSSANILPDASTAGNHRPLLT